MPAITEAHRLACEAAGRTRMTPEERLEARREAGRARPKQQRTEDARRYRLQNGQQPKVSLLKWRESNPELPVEAYRVEQVEKRRAMGRRYYQNHKAEHRAYQMQASYGISITEYEARVIAQEGRCAICGQLTQTLSVDHDHITRRVRGLLCSVCNLSIGQMGESPERLRKAAEYLEATKYQQ